VAVFAFERELSIPVEAGGVEISRLHVAIIDSASLDRIKFDGQRGADSTRTLEQIEKVLRQPAPTAERVSLALELVEEWRLKQ